MSKRLLVLPIVAALALGACEDSTSPSGNTGRLTIELTDAPGDLAAAYVTITKITLVGTADDGESESLEFEPEETGYVSLLDLAGGQALSLVDGAEVPAGQYSEMRIYLDDAYVTLNDDRVFATSGATLPSGVTAAGELKCPSCSQSGFKVKFMDGGLVIDDNEETTVRIDFDVAASFGHEAGQSGMWIMHPVLRATTNTFARVTGTVTAPASLFPLTCGALQFGLTDVRLPVTFQGETYSGTVAAGGALTFATLVPGTYVFPLTFTQTLTNGYMVTVTGTATPASVTINDWGQAVTANYTIATATCAAGAGT